MTNKKGKLIAVASLFCVMILGIVGLIWFGLTDKEVDKTQVVKVTASDETALRELLLEDANMEIEVTESMMIEEGFVVNGTKKLTGDATIQMYIGAPFDQSILTVSSEATLTMDGLVLDGNHLADGITVDKGASLLYLSGKMEYTETFGIIANGDVVIKDMLMEHAQEGTLKVCKGATVSMEGGSFVDTWYGGVFIEEGGNMTIGGDTVMDGSIVAAMIYNNGNLKITGGKFCNSGSYAVRNYNQLEIAYEGDDENGYIEFTSNSRAAVRTEKEAVSNISDIYVHDTRSNAVVTVGGETTITDSRIETTKDHGVEAQQGHVVVKNVTVSDTLAGAGVYAGPSANVEIEDCDIARTASNGIAANSGTITAKGLTITGVTRYGVAVGNSQTAEPSKVTVTETRITDAGKFGVYVYGTSEATVVDTTISGFTKEETTGIFIASKASCTLEGDSVVEGAKQRGVKTLGTFVMNGGTIQKNMSPLHGAGMYVGPAATFTMNGGEIKDNSNMTKNAGGMFVDGGKVTIDGGKICNNSTMLSGGGIYAYKGATVYLKSGEIDGNIAGTSGDGIYFKGENTTVTVGKEFYMGNNDVRVATTEVMLDVESDSLTKHSASKPLLVTPGDTFEQGTKVVRCKSVAAATKLNDVVKSGDGSFKLNKNDKYYEIEYTKADMDMTGADTVYVSNFAEFKAAVTGTTSKRYVVLKADIAMESAVRVPGGTTVCIKDDGNVRKLTRAAGMTDKFLTTLYGTGLYLQGTKEGNLILDGSCSTGVDVVSAGSLVYAAGSTVVKGVVLQNNGAAVEASRTRGALLNQWYGDVSIYDSVLAGGSAYTAGAVVVSSANGYIANSQFKNNTSYAGGGAIRMEKGAKVEVENSTFVGNTAGSTGGAIVSVSAAKLTVTDTTFDGNAALTGGAVRVMGSNNSAFFRGTESSNTALFTNNSTNNEEEGKGGAIYVDGSVQVMVDGYSFTKNSASGYGGAVYATNAKSTVSLSNSTFYENTAGNSGAAVACDGSNANIISCELGKENAGNVAASKGGAVIVMGKGKVQMSIGGGSNYQALAYNSAKIGGAVCVYKGTFVADGYTYANNSAQDGAGIYVYAAGTATSSNATFKGNAAEKESQKNYGGAVCAYGTYQSTDDTYEANTARIGGAAFVAENVSADFIGTKGLFNGNIATGNGGAIYAKDSANVTVNGYSFNGNEAKIGGAVYAEPATNPEAKVTLKNSSFYGNTAKDSGAAIACNGSKVDIISCEIGKENAGNEAASKGGAVLVLGNGVVNMRLEDSLSYKTVAYNSAASGGAIYVIEGELVVDGYDFTNNTADKRGGAVFIEKGTAKLTGANSIFKENASELYGGAIHIHTNCSLITVDGYTFEENTSNKGSAISILTGVQNAQITNSTFTGQAESQVIWTNGTVTFEGLNGATLVQGSETAVFVTSSSIAADSQVKLTPSAHKEGLIVLEKTDELSAEAWADAYTNLAVTSKGDGSLWKIDENGSLKCEGTPVASLEGTTGTQYYNSIAEAVAAANEQGGTGDADAIVITVLQNTAIAEEISVSKNVTIVNKTGTEVTISRGSDYTGNLLVATGEGKLQLGTASAEETGKLIVDGGSTSVSGRTIYITGANATFILQKNATLQNALSTASGAAICNKGTCELYGSMLNNQSSSAGSEEAFAAGAILQCRGSKTLTIYGGTYTGNKNTGEYGGGGLIGTQVTKSGSSAGAITIKGGTFSGNEAACGGVIYTYTDKTVTIEGGTFDNNKATVTNGGVICAASTAGDIIVSGGTFTNNKAVASSSKSNGGVICAEAGTASDGAANIIISAGTFQNNQASLGGVVAVMNYAELEITGGSFTNNESTRYGGGVVYVCVATAEISNATMTGNCAPSSNAAYYGGGAISIHRASTVTLKNCTIHGNTHAGRLSDESKNANGCDITFSGGNNTSVVSKLILQDETFDGIVGHLSSSKKAKMQVVISDVTQSAAYGTRYTVNFIKKELEEVQ